MLSNILKRDYCLKENKPFISDTCLEELNKIYLFIQFYYIRTKISTFAHLPHYLINTATYVYSLQQTISVNNVTQEDLKNATRLFSLIQILEKTIESKLRNNEIDESRIREIDSYIKRQIMKCDYGNFDCVQQELFNYYYNL